MFDLFIGIQGPLGVGKTKFLMNLEKAMIDQLSPSHHRRVCYKPDFLWNDVYYRRHYKDEDLLQAMDEIWSSTMLEDLMKKNVFPSVMLMEEGWPGYHAEVLYRSQKTGTDLISKPRSFLKSAPNFNECFNVCFIPFDTVTKLELLNYPKYLDMKPSWLHTSNDDFQESVKFHWDLKWDLISDVKNADSLVPLMTEALRRYYKSPVNTLYRDLVIDIITRSELFDYVIKTDTSLIHQL